MHHSEPVKSSSTSLFSSLAFACAASASVNHSTLSLRAWQTPAQNANSKNNRLMSQQKQRILDWIFKAGAIGNWCFQRIGEHLNFYAPGNSHDFFPSSRPSP